MSSSELESTPHSSAESSDCRPATKRQRLVQVLENENVSLNDLVKYRCEVEGCTSKGIHPRRLDGVLACKAHRRNCAYSCCRLVAVQSSSLCEDHTLGRLQSSGLLVARAKCSISSCKSPAWPFAPRHCESHARFCEESVPRYNQSLAVQSLQKTGKAPVWAGGNLTGDPLQDNRMRDPVGHSLGHYWKGPDFSLNSLKPGESVHYFAKDWKSDENYPRRLEALIAAKSVLEYVPPPKLTEEHERRILMRVSQGVDEKLRSLVPGWLPEEQKAYYAKSRAGECISASEEANHTRFLSEYVKNIFCKRE